MKYSLFQQIFTITLTILICYRTCIMETDSDEANSREKRFLNPRSGTALNLNQLRQVSRYYGDLKMRAEKIQKKKERLHHLTGRISNFFIRDFNPMRI